jgi:hypothetical protein
MKKHILFPLIFLVMLFVSGCAVVGGIFKAGVWVGVLIVVAILAVIIFIVSKAARK